MFGHHIDHAKQAGLLTGAYLFLLPASLLGQSMDYQVDVFLRTAKQAGVDWYCIDWEGEEHHDPPTKAELIRAVRLVQAKGIPCGVYSSEGYPYPAVGQDWRWVANYSREPRIRYDIWQYRGSGLDRNRMKTPLAEFRAKAERRAPSPEVKFILAYNPPKSIDIPAGTRYLDLAGNEFGVEDSDTKALSIGLADGHTNHYVAKIHTARFAPDGRARDYWVQAVLP